MNNLKGKRMLLMSGSQDACEIVKVAHQLGVVVYATDYYETSPVKKISDKSFMVSTADVDSIVELCKEEKIDGIFSGFTDSVLPYMQQVAERLNIPFWGDAKNIEICIDKMKFKRACELSGVKTVPWMSVTPHDYQEKIKQAKCPVVVKPVDNSGSRGVYKCFKKEDLKDLCDKSFGYSQKKELLIEKLMDVNHEFSAYYIMDGKGEALLTSLGDRYVDVVDEGTAPQAKGMFFPSVHLAPFIEKVDKNMKEFFKENKMKNGFAFVQGFEEKGEFYINEIGYRLNGGFTYKFTEYFNRYSPLTELLRFSLSGAMNASEVKKTDPHYSGLGLLITISLKEGLIGYISGLKKIKGHPHVLDVITNHFVGDDLRAHGTSTQIFGYVFCVATNKDELTETVNFVRENLIVEDEMHNSLLIGIIDASTIKTKQ